MLKIKPIRDKLEQAAYCAKCSVTYDEEMLAYAAYEEDTFLGICQFCIHGDCGFLRDLAPADGVEDFEALFIMGRSTLNFIDLCGAHTAMCRRGAGSDRLLTAVGFREEGGEHLIIHMEGMFDGSHHHKKEH